MGTSIRTFKDLLVWQRAFGLCLMVLRSTNLLPLEERFGLAAELRKTVRSVVYNIAEGHRRRSTADYLRFLDIAVASLAELETQLLLARSLQYLDEPSSEALLAHLQELERMLSAFMRSLRRRLRPFLVP
jgi:four helix bundle protein